MVLKRILGEESNYFYLDVLLLFLLVNFDFHVSTIYIAMAIVGGFFYYVAKDTGYFTPYPIKNQQSLWAVIIIVGAVSYAIFNFAYGMISNYFAAAPAFNQMVVEVFASTGTPALQESLVLKFIVWGVLIPITETRFFFRTFMQWLAKDRKIDLNDPLSKSGLTISFIISAIFTLFHITAKGVTGTSQLAATFVFAFISMFLVLKYREVGHAVTFHVIVNSLSMYIIFFA